jgi:adenine phosphoribosyltransferase
MATWFAPSDLYRVISDFPSSGIQFRDISVLLNKPEVFQRLVEDLVRRLQTVHVTKVVAIESRGFLLGAPLALALRKPLVMVRKDSKLPGPVIKAVADVEYRKDTRFEIQADALVANDHVVVVDDILATGGSVLAAKGLIERLGAQVSAFVFITIIPECMGVARLAQNTPVPILFASETPPPINVVRELEPARGNLIIVHPDMVSWVKKEVPVWDMGVSVHILSFDYFADGYPNFRFPEKLVTDSRVLYIGTMYDYKGVMDQLHHLIVWSRYARHVTVLFPWYGPATMEKLCPNEVATADTMAHLISDTQRQNMTIVLIDPHVPTVRFSFDEKTVRYRCLSMVDTLLRHFDRAFVSDETGYMLVFPDQGAKKRFLPLVYNYFQSGEKTSNRMPPYMVMSKTRRGDERKVVVEERVNGWFASSASTPVIIFDDLVQSGRTIAEVATLLSTEGFTHINASCIHAVLPNKDHYMSFTKGGLYEGKLRRFFVTNTNPQRTSILQHLDPFRIIDVSGDVLSQLGVGRDYIFAKVASSNPHKLAALNMLTPRFGGCSVESGVPEQPIGWDQIRKGCVQRRSQLVYCNPTYLRVAMENGVVDGQDVGMVQIEYNGRLYEAVSEGVPVDSAVLDQAVANQTTVGSLLADRLGCSKSNWHVRVCGVNRSYLLYEALCKALASSSVPIPVSVPGANRSVDFRHVESPPWSPILSGTSACDHEATPSEINEGEEESMSEVSDDELYRAGPDDIYQ